MLCAFTEYIKGKQTLETIFETTLRKFPENKEQNKKWNENVSLA
jgi:hypothetical protein